MARITAMATCYLLISLLGHAQYAGGSGRGEVQSGALPDDCAGIPGGTAMPGMDCDDNDPCTIGDLWSCTCVCLGTVSADTDGDGLCDPIDPCNTGDACNDGTACTTDDVYDANCICAGTPTGGLGAILGNWLLADGLGYVFSTSYVAGADYQWSIQPDTAGWILVAQDSTVQVTAPPINAQVQLCVSATQGDECLLYACTDLFVMDVGVQETSGTAQRFTVHPNPSDGRFELVYSGPLGQVRYDVQDALGRTVHLSGTTRAAKTLIDLGNTVPGVYLLRVDHERGTDVLRLVVR